MGSRGAMNVNGGFNTPLEFRKIGTIEYELDGKKMSVKILTFTKSTSRKLPESSNTSDAYVSLDKNGKPKQLRVYERRIASFDVDFDQSHHYGLKDWQYHVHRIAYVNELLTRSIDGRDQLTPKEWKRWEPLISKLSRLRNE